MNIINDSKKRIFYAETNYDQDEINSVNDVLKNQSFSLVGGSFTKKFEKNISRLFGKKYGVFVNSGSSANLLALTSLKLKKGSEVITPCLTFSTTVSPILQLGLIPNFIDIELRTLNIDANKIENAINNKTSAIMIPNLMGNLPNWLKIKEMADKYSLPIIEDSADTLGYKYNNETTSEISDLVTTSFYASHIITCGGIGGMVCTNNFDLYKNIIIKRGWGRRSELFDPDKKLLSKKEINTRFEIEIDDINYDRKFLFEETGYNFFAPEICAAFGNTQLEKFKSLYDKRVANFEYFKNTIQKNLDEYFITPFQYQNVETIWLAFPLILKKSHSIKSRNTLQIFLEERNIQTRPIFSGNVTKQPMMKGYEYISNKMGYENSDYIMKNGMLVGCHPKLTFSDIDYICELLKEFFND
jgi:CDP-4-dehydro-6-deoxyglucose reductase, E1